MKTLRLLGCLIILSGCSATYEQVIVQPTASKLERGKGVFISVPKDGWYGKIEYRNSGRMTADAVKSAFSRFSNTVDVSTECIGKECLKKINPNQYTYYVEPLIMHWEDRNTEWSGIPDRIEIKLIIYDVKTGVEIASSIMNGKSKWATFGGDHPQDLLPEPINAYVASLY
jgi:hypothetical protein